ncbi:MAG: DUF3310 domain-containing protein [Rhizobiaceae bacterium]|nr:DUF3310 domain-containing protein [Rhizobiaceae bacterium]
MSIKLQTFLEANEDLNSLQRETIALVLGASPKTSYSVRALERAQAMIQKSLDSGSVVNNFNTEGDMVNRPNHYTRFEIEPTYMAMSNDLNWCEGNFLKYICRYPYKNGAEDLRKAMRYLEMYIKYLQGDTEWSL